MNFEYSQTVTMTADIEIEDVGNCAIIAYTAIKREYILVIDTLQGWTRILKYGPKIIDVEELPSGISVSYTKIEFDLRKLVKTISSFLNSPDVIQAKLVTKDEALAECSSLVDEMKKDWF